MDALSLAHLFLIGLWGGLILGETVIEWLGRDEASRAFAARAHFWIDVLLELPLVAAVLVTGAFLAARAWPPAPLLMVKIGLALLAIGVNAYCAGLVALRYRLRHDAVETARLSTTIRWTWAVVPAGLGALYIGLRWYV